MYPTSMEEVLQSSDIIQRRALMTAARPSCDWAATIMCTELNVFFDA